MLQCANKLLDCRTPGWTDLLRVKVWKVTHWKPFSASSSHEFRKTVRAELTFRENKSAPVLQKMAAAGTTCIAFQAVRTLVTPAPWWNLTREYSVEWCLCMFRKLRLLQNTLSMLKYRWERGAFWCSELGQAAPVKLNCNHTHIHTQVVFCLGNDGSWLPRAQRPVFFYFLSFTLHKISVTK